MIYSKNTNKKPENRITNPQWGTIIVLVLILYKSEPGTLMDIGILTSRCPKKNDEKLFTADTLSSLCLGSINLEVHSSQAKKCCIKTVSGETAWECYLLGVYNPAPDI